MKELIRLPDDLDVYLRECCDETGHGSFRISSRRSGDVVQLALEATPSQRYEGNGDLLIGFVIDDKGKTSTTAERTVRSLAEVADRIIRRLVEIWHEAAGNGSVEVSCRRQRNGKTRIRIRHSFDDEVVLRPEEVQVSVSTEASPVQ